MTMKLERYDLYTKDGRQTGKTAVRGERPPEGCCRLIVHVCIFGPDGRMLIQRRQPWKHSFPGLWDISVSGSVMAGEDSISAIVREIREEIGLDIGADELSLAVTMHGERRIDDVYILNKDVDTDALTLGEDEVAEVKWADMDEIESMTAAGVFVAYRREWMRLLFSIRDGGGAIIIK